MPIGLSPGTFGASIVLTTRVALQSNHLEHAVLGLHTAPEEHATRPEGVAGNLETGTNRSAPTRPPTRPEGVAGNLETGTNRSAPTRPPTTTGNHDSDRINDNITDRDNSTDRDNGTGKNGTGNNGTGTNSGTGNNGTGTLGMV